MTALQQLGVAGVASTPWSGALKISVAALEKHGLEVFESCPESVVLHQLCRAKALHVAHTTIDAIHTSHERQSFENFRLSGGDASERGPTTARVFKAITTASRHSDALPRKHSMKNVLPAKALLQALWKLVGDEPSEVPRLRHPRHLSFFVRFAQPCSKPSPEPQDRRPAATGGLGLGFRGPAMSSPNLNKGLFTRVVRTAQSRSWLVYFIAWSLSASPPDVRKTWLLSRASAAERRKAGTAADGSLCDFSLGRSSSVSASLGKARRCCGCWRCCRARAIS